MFDAHCHLQFQDFDGTDPVEECRKAGLRGVILADYDSERRARMFELAREPGIWATCGIHPWAVETSDDWREREVRAFEEALDRDGWIGVGEFGLDDSRASSSADRELQREICRMQLEAARRRDLPVVLHIVEAHDAMLGVLSEIDWSGTGMCHGFSGTPEEAKRFVDLGFHISIGTNAARGNVGRVREVCRAIPSGRLLVETDAPSRPPDGVDGPNHPRYVSRVIEAVSSFTGRSESSVAEETERNARDLFGLGDETL